MKELKFDRWNGRAAQSTAGFCTSDSRSYLLTSSFWSQEKVFLEKRTQTLPVIIDDHEKTNPKRTHINPQKANIWALEAKSDPKFEPLKLFIYNLNAETTSNTFICSNISTHHLSHV